MFRSIFGFAVLALVAWLALKIVFGLLGGLVGLAMTVLMFAAVGFVFYILLRMISPSTADKVREMIKRRPYDAVDDFGGAADRGVRREHGAVRDARGRQGRGQDRRDATSSHPAGRARPNTAAAAGFRGGR